jgi:hypothetical protein
MSTAHVTQSNSSASASSPTAGEPTLIVEVRNGTRKLHDLKGQELRDIWCWFKERPTGAKSSGSLKSKEALITWITPQIFGVAIAEAVEIVIEERAEVAVPAVGGAKRSNAASYAIVLSGKEYAAREMLEEKEREKARVTGPGAVERIKEYWGKYIHKEGIGGRQRQVLEARMQGELNAASKARREAAAAEKTAKMEAAVARKLGQERLCRDALVTKHGLTSSEAEAVLAHFGKGSFPKDTLTALRVINGFAAKNGIRFEDAETVLRE